MKVQTNSTQNSSICGVMNVNVGRKHFGNMVMGRPTQNDQTRAARQLVEQNSDQVCDESRTVLRYPVINTSTSISSPEPRRGEYACRSSNHHGPLRPSECRTRNQRIDSGEINQGNAYRSTIHHDATHVAASIAWYPDS